MKLTNLGEARADGAKDLKEPARGVSPLLGIMVNMRQDDSQKNGGLEILETDRMRSAGRISAMRRMTRHIIINGIHILVKESILEAHSICVMYNSWSSYIPGIWLVICATRCSELLLQERLYASIWLSRINAFQTIQEAIFMVAPVYILDTSSNSLSLI